MKTVRHWCTVGCLLLLGSWGCGDDEKENRIEGPDFRPGPGRAYQIQQVSFPSADGVQISALLGDPQGTLQTGQRLPVVILVHDLFGSKEEWIFFLEQLLQRQYLTLAIDLRGHGQTPLPDDSRPTPDLSLEDLEKSYLDVQAALKWVEAQPQADASRVALIGNGLGGNVAFVSTGVFPGQIEAAVALSPGLWDSRTLEPVVVGTGLNPFAPHSILFLVGADDVIPLDTTGQLEFASFAGTLADKTNEPKTVKIFSNSSDHGLDLLHNKPEAVQLLLAWLQNYL
ncbi:MAG: alpha/beta fold hydrolase [Candidatus Latescibacteria bacterium]|nr:alpha/beta fold hydrolase [Candidatus Latescibacterota bacterium]